MHGNKDVDTYLAGIVPEFRNELEKLRRTIPSATPGADEGFHYGVPAFYMYGRSLVCFAAFRKHCGFYPLSPAIIARFTPVNLCRPRSSGR